ncbi:MAG: hypothetical protein COB81_03660 [Flavobacteriaceae bacterium]|nr:MAG: hypothetical protein COB81_03660 [Flavobacteriaceae bacterium]
MTENNSKKCHNRHKADKFLLESFRKRSEYELVSGDLKVMHIRFNISEKGIGFVIKMYIYLLKYK